jgi:hypothetical protein
MADRKRPVSAAEQFCFGVINSSLF